MTTAMGGKSPAQMFALVFGIVYLAIGILGFAVEQDFLAEADKAGTLIIFPVNGLLNVVHIAIGALWIGASRTHAAAKGVNMLVGAVYLLVFLLGMVGVLKFLAIEDAASTNNYLHLATSLLALYFGSAGAERKTAATPA